QGGGSESLDLAVLPAPIRDLVRGVYGDVIGGVFVYAALISAVAVLAVLFIKEVPLRSSNALTAETPTAEQAGPAPTPPTVGAVGAPVAPAPLGSLTGRVVIGRVLRGDGRPLAGASVTLTDVSGRQ